MITKQKTGFRPVWNSLHTPHRECVMRAIEYYKVIRPSEPLENISRYAAVELNGLADLREVFEELERLRGVMVIYRGYVASEEAINKYTLVGLIDMRPTQKKLLADMDQWMNVTVPKTINSIKMIVLTYFISPDRSGEIVEYLEGDHLQSKTITIEVIAKVLQGGYDGIAARVKTIAGVYKDYALESPIWPGSTPDMDPIQRLVTRAGLIPVTLYSKPGESPELTALELAPILSDDNQRLNQHEELTAWCVARRCTLVIICRPARRIEFDINPLLKPYGLNLRSGLNKAAVTRYRTIRADLTAPDIVRPSINIYNHAGVQTPTLMENKTITCETALVLETPDMVYYRVLSKPQAADEDRLNQLFCKSLEITHVLNERVLRSDAYHSQACELIQSKCFNKSNRLTVDRYMQSAIYALPAGSTVDICARGLEQWFNSHAVETEAAFQRLYVDAANQLVKILQQEVANSFKEITPELRLTYEAKLDPAKNDFLRLMTSKHVNLSMAGVPAGDRRRHFMQIWSELVRQVLADMQKNKTFDEVDISFKDFVLEENIVIM